MLRFYNPFDWYWLRGDGKLYSSKAQEYITDSDPTYTMWSDGGGVATIWPQDEKGAQTDVALQDVLKPYNLNLPAAAKTEG
jgi:hypothetical protein